VDCEDGDEECNRTPVSSKLKITGFTSSGSKCSFVFAGGMLRPLGVSLMPSGPFNLLTGLEVHRVGLTLYCNTRMGCEL
jgi:hypothetical protein